MPASFIGELILQPVLELALQVAGYLTGRVVVPLFSLGFAYVEPAPKGVRVTPGFGGFARDSRGKIFVEADMGSFLGLLFWFFAGAVGYAIYKYAV